ncbi:MAG: hypothetical protein IT158_02545 [Bryobacterales bacterium]|nr:hypothetical protein [Bryobacterales bacterium]
MTWLIRLYPPAWRRRYGQELAELLAAQPASLRTAIDLVAGAVDAWLNPQSSTAAMAVDPKGQGRMIAMMLKLRDAGCGAKPTRADAIKAAAVTIGGSLALVLALMWAKARYGENPYLKSLALVSWMVPMLFGLSYTELKGHSGRVKAAFVGGLSAIVIAIALAAAWLNNN